MTPADRRSYQAGKAAQKGFTAAERKVFLHGYTVQWKDGGKWHPGVVVGMIHKDATGRDYIDVRNTGAATRNVAANEVTRAYPGSVRKG
jgi:hypothetical protein